VTPRRVWLLVAALFAAQAIVSLWLVALDVALAAGVALVGWALHQPGGER
jgi:hypothetical protein